MAGSRPEPGISPGVFIDENRSGIASRQRDHGAARIRSVVQKAEYNKSGRNAAVVKLKFKNLLNRRGQRIGLQGRRKVRRRRAGPQGMHVFLLRRPDVRLHGRRSTTSTRSRPKAWATRSTTWKKACPWKWSSTTAAPSRSNCPPALVREITYTEPAVRGDTSGKVLKPAKINTGYEHERAAVLRNRRQDRNRHPHGRIPQPGEQLRPARPLRHPGPGRMARTASALRRESGPFPRTAGIAVDAGDSKTEGRLATRNRRGRRPTSAAHAGRTPAWAARFHRNDSSNPRPPYVRDPAKFRHAAPAGGHAAVHDAIDDAIRRQQRPGAARPQAPAQAHARRYSRPCGARSPSTPYARRASCWSMNPRTHGHLRQALRPVGTGPAQLGQTRRPPDRGGTPHR